MWCEYIIICISTYTSQCYIMSRYPTLHLTQNKIKRKLVNDSFIISSNGLIILRKDIII